MMHLPVASRILFPFVVHLHSKPSFPFFRGRINVARWYRMQPYFLCAGVCLVYLWLVWSWLSYDPGHAICNQCYLPFHRYVLLVSLCVNTVYRPGIGRVLFGQDSSTTLQRSTLAMTKQFVAFALVESCPDKRDLWPVANWILYHCEAFCRIASFGSLRSFWTLVTVFGDGLAPTIFVCHSNLLWRIRQR